MGCLKRRAGRGASFHWSGAIRFCWEHTVHIIAQRGLQTTLAGLLPLLGCIYIRMGDVFFRHLKSSRSSGRHIERDIDISS
jgi:hypothetical protein